jgi:hypothetical protein
LKAIYRGQAIPYGGKKLYTRKHRQEWLVQLAGGPPNLPVFFPLRDKGCPSLCGAKGRLGEEGPVKIGAPSIPPFAAQRVGAGGPANLPVFVFPFETTGAPLFA